MANTDVDATTLAPLRIPTSARTASTHSRVSDPYARLQVTKKGKTMKALSVTSIGEYGEHTISHPIYECSYESDLILATLQGVLKAGQTIKSFELVEA